LLQKIRVIVVEKWRSQEER